MGSIHCAFCGHWFRRTRKWQRFCSTPCRKAQWRKERDKVPSVCPKCGYDLKQHNKTHA